jgi:two-component system sensor histidine kinase UhpB
MGAQTLEALLGKTDFEFYPQTLAAQYQADEQEVFTSGRPLVDQEEPVIDPRGNQHTLLTTKVPLKDSNEKIMGLVGISRDITERKQAEVEKSRLLEAVTQQRQELRALAARLAESQETERQNLARELHDKMGQNLTGLSFNLKYIQKQLDSTAAKNKIIQTRLEDSLVLIEQIIDHLRDVMTELRPPMLDDYGLVKALEWHAHRFAIRMGLTVKISGNPLKPRLDEPTENAFFWIAQEALTNAAKHAQAHQVTISIKANNHRVRMVITDDGLGFAPDPAKQLAGDSQRGWGLLIMKERAEAVGGKCWLESQIGWGTRVMVEVER